MYYLRIIIIIIIIINCNWIVTRWQWLFYMYTNYGKDGKTDPVNVPVLRQNVFSVNVRRSFALSAAPTNSLRNYAQNAPKYASLWYRVLKSSRPVLAKLRMSRHIASP